MRALIVGCGFTGSAIARFLSERIQNIEVTIWEKARGVGGRMSTSRCPGRPECTADLGAQYISATPAYLEKHRRFYEELQSSGIIAPLSGVIEGDRNHVPGTKHFVAPKGISTVVKFFLDRAGTAVDARFGQRLLKLDLQGATWEAESESGHKACFDAVVLTMPTPQILQLTGSVAALLRDSADVHSMLSGVVYSSRYAVALFLPPGTELPVQWAAKYFPEDPCVRFVSLDHRKRLPGGGGGGGAEPSLVVHTSVPFGVAHLEESLDRVQEIVIGHVRRLLPWLQMTEDMVVKCHRWRYSQVHAAAAGGNGAAAPGFVNASRAGEPPLVCAGDAFVHSNFDGCLTSAEAASEWLASSLLSRSSR